MTTTDRGSTRGVHLSSLDDEEEVGIMSPPGAIIISVFVCARVVYVEKSLGLSLFALLDYVLIHCFGPMCINYTRIHLAGFQSVQIRVHIHMVI